MIDFRNDIGTLFELAFGTSMPMFIPYPLQVNRPAEVKFQSSQPAEVSNAVKFSDVTLKPELTGTRMSQYGHPVWSPIAFLGNQYKKFDVRGNLVSVDMKDFSLPATTLVDISRSKIMNETVQNAGEGAVVEMYGFENWSISIRGLCLADAAHPTHKTADEQKKALLEWENLASGIYVAGDVFTEREISYIAIKSMRTPQLEGRPNVVPFEIQAIGLTAPEIQYL